MTSVFRGYSFAFLLHTAVVLAALLIYAISTHTSGQRRHPSAAIAWVLMITLLPYIGLPLYLFVGNRKFVRPARRRPQPPSASTLAPGLQGCAIATLEGMGLAEPVANRQVRFHRDGSAAWEEFVALVNKAQTQLDICTYILAHDALGERVVALLEARAAAGVQIRLLLDAVGSWQTAANHVRRLRAAGVQVHWFMPLLHNPLKGRVNLRNHRKLAIADQQTVWSGGRNLAAEYFTGDASQPPWLDLSFTVEGPLAVQMQALFESHWYYSQGPRPPDDHETDAPPSFSEPQMPLRTMAQTSSKAHVHSTQLVPSGPDQAEDTFYGLLLTTLYRAQRRVLAVTPYFVPDDSLLKALCLAAQRGVQVDLVVPARSNHRLADIARARALRDLVAAGAVVRLAPGMVHAKAVVVDDAIALCGSLNLDARSLFLNFEVMVAFYDGEDISAVTQWVDGNFRHLPPHQPTPASLVRDIAEGLVRWLGFQI
jgi:cardiolipin synthase